jgi:hypothetical protein
MIRTVIRLKNDMVMVFDEDGEQLPEYQGSYAEVRESILKDAPPDTVFAHWTGQKTKPQTVARTDW